MADHTIRSDPDNESVTIQSSELFLLKNELAGIGSRAFAFCIDVLIRGGAVTLLFILFSIKPFTVRPMGLLVGVITLLWWNGYFIFFETVYSGKSPGKMIVGIRVLKNDGSKISVLDSCIRNLMRVVDMLPAGYLLALVTMIFEPFNRRPGDIVANTIVIYDRSANKSIKDFTDNMLIESRPRTSVQINGISRLTVDEKRIIKNLYSRLGTLKNGPQKDELMNKFDERIRRKVTVTGTDDPEILLCELYKRI
ncbi:MAG: RDD family protein [Chitinispirillaceae bacterium]|nr:RDD family protein [Chitinispirillaceae bacterium]